jgi:hypothetical protein
MSSRLPSDDQRLLIVRDGLAVLYRRAGREERLAELYGEIGICERGLMSKTPFPDNLKVCPSVSPSTSMSSL